MATSLLLETRTRSYAGQDPIGKRINVEFTGLAQIVGVAGHVKHWRLDTDAKKTIQAQLYMPMMQLPDKFMAQVVRDQYIVRSVNAPAALTAPVRDLVQQTGANQVAYGFETMDDVVADSLAARRFSMFLLGVFAALALVLASVGVYGVISYLSGQRTQEIGIRMALGAQTGDVVNLVVRQGALLAATGVGVGVISAFAVTRFMARLLDGVRPSDPVTFGAVALLLSVVAGVASYIPARRAAKVEPIVALRYE